jgi:hypothetical protein
MFAFLAPRQDPAPTLEAFLERLARQERAFRLRRRLRRALPWLCLPALAAAAAFL